MFVGRSGQPCHYFLIRTPGIDIDRTAGEVIEYQDRARCTTFQHSLGGQDVRLERASGNASIAVTCTCNVISAISSGAKLALVVPRDGMFVVADGYYIHKGIPAGNYYYAQVFANYLYSAQTQAYLAKDQGLVPSVPGTPVPQYMKDQPRAFPLTAAQIKAANGVVAPIPLIATYNDQWQLAFENAIK